MNGSAISIRVQAQNYYPEYLWRNQRHGNYGQRQWGKANIPTIWFTRAALNFIRINQQHPFSLPRLHHSHANND